jgi:hypothetical protein
MLPAIWPGDLLTVAPATKGKPAPGDVALILRDGSWLVHRVVERRMHGDAVALLTRGDALDRSDPATPSAAILGVVIARNGRPLVVPQTVRMRTLAKLCRLAGRSGALLILIVKLRALMRSRVAVAV